MSLFKREDSSRWWVKIRIDGRCVQKSTGTDDRKQAQEFHDRLKAELWEQSRLGVKPGYLWQEAVMRWIEETGHKASHDSDKKHLRWLDGHLALIRLMDINRDTLDGLIAARRKSKSANGTTNRMLALVRSILRKAVHEWEWLDRMPKVRLLPEPKRRVRYLMPEEADLLLLELPEHLAAMARFSLETGLRQANVTGLQWSQVDLVRKVAWIHADQAKARKAIAVPLSEVAVMTIRQQLGKHDSHVFSYHGKPVKQPNNHAWQKALKRAGIDDFRWHDLRHTWASWHAQRGTPLNVLQELGAWESVEMVRRYAHLSGEHLSEYAQSMTGQPHLVGTKRLRSGS